MHQIFQSQCSVFFRGQQPNFNKCPIVFFLWCLICVNMILRWNMLSPDRLTTDKIYYNLSFSHGQAWIMWYIHSPGFSRVGIASGIHQIQLCPNQGKLGEQTNLQQRIIQPYIVQCRKSHTTNINSNRDIQIISEILFEHF